MEVEIDVGKVQDPALDFVLPAWAPGRYAVYDFAKNVQEFEATGAEGRPLAWTKLDKQTWHVGAGNAGGQVRVRYRVYGNDLTGSFSQFDTSHAHVNGASVYMYVAGHKQDSLTLTVEAPPEWKLFSGFSTATEQRSFTTPNYDILIDTPVEVSAECYVEQFEEQGKTFRVAVHSYSQDEETKPQPVRVLSTLDLAAGTAELNESPKPGTVTPPREVSKAHPQENKAAKTRVPSTLDLAAGTAELNESPNRGTATPPGDVSKPHAEEENKPRSGRVASTANTLGLAAGTAELSEGPKLATLASRGDLSKLVEGIRKVVRAEMTMMPAPDFQTYTFIFHFAPDISEGDGMEHLNSTDIIVRGALSDSLLAEALSDAAHEFFHAWNVKRLRPAGLGPFDYTRETYTRSLWFAEGVTSYFSDLSLLRSGIWSRREFLAALAGEIRTLETEPGRLLMSAESSSFHAWFYDRSPQMQETNFANSTVNYYNKGLVLGMLLDLEVRSRTLGRKSLDDVLRLMYRQFYEATPSGYYGPGRGYEEKDVLDAVNSVAGSDFTSFFDRYVRGTQPLPYNEILAQAGLKLQVATGAGASPTIGVITGPVLTGVKILAVRPESAADRAGLSRDDLVIAVDGLSLAPEDLTTRLKMYAPGTDVLFTVERHGRRQTIPVKLDPPTTDEYTIEEVTGAAPEQVAVREGWLRGAVTSAQ